MLRFEQKAVRERLAASGWEPTRQMPLPQKLVEAGLENHPGAEILRSLSGIRVGVVGSGRECATSDVNFCWLDDEFDDDVGQWEELLGTKLVGVAEVHHSHGALYVAEDGRCFGQSLIHDAFCFEGANLEEALVRFFVGLRTRPMLRPDQDSVMLYGIVFHRDSPEIYRYETVG